MQPLPKSRDERPLIQFVEPEHALDELVLPTATRAMLDEVVGESQPPLRDTLLDYGLRPRQRLLFIGPPGTGKTAAAHGIAAALGVPVATASLAALVASFLGETARNIEQVVRFAEHTRCVLVIDEFDVIGQARDVADHGELRRVAATVLQLLERLPGDSMVVATSNHRRLLDTAVWRRFDDVVGFDALDEHQLAALVELKLRAIRSAISPVRWAGQLSELSAAEVELTCLDAMRRALRAGRAAVQDADMAAAVDRMRARLDVRWSRTAGPTVPFGHQVEPTGSATAGPWPAPTPATQEPTEAAGTIPVSDRWWHNEHGPDPVPTAVVAALAARAAGHQPASGDTPGEGGGA